MDSKNTSTETWIERLEETDPLTRLRAVSALGELIRKNLSRPTLGRVQEETHPPLEPLAKRLRDDPEKLVRAEAAWSLGEIGSEPAAAPLIEALKDPEPGVRASAAEALGKVGGSQALSALAEALADSSVDVRLCAVQALHKLGGKGAETRPRQTLGQKQAEGVLFNRLSALVQGDQDGYVRLQAARALLAMGGDEAASVLREAIKKGQLPASLEM